MIACYLDRTSAFPGETVTLHASSDSRVCTLELARVGAQRVSVWRRDDIEVGHHSTPVEADRLGCGWTATVQVDVGAGWRSGYYDVVLTDATGEEAHHFLCVKAPRETPNRMVLLLTTNTLHAYNSWGGRSAYCDVDALMSRRARLPEAMANCLGVLSTQRPISQMLLAAPTDMPRLVNLEKRGFEQRPWAGADPAWSRDHSQSPYDGSAGFLNKWEHVFVRWAEQAGYDFDYLTDYDLDADPDALVPYGVALLVGHSEYWSGPQRDRIEAFVDSGGFLAIFSGNTGFWKVRWDDGGRTLACHKWKGETAETVTASDRTHLWSHPMFGRPEAEITGLSFIFGGYHRLGLCAARGQGGYTVYRPDHWLLEGADLFWGDVFGEEIPLLGYENDGCAITFDESGLPVSRAILGVPVDLEIVAMAPAAFAESPSGYRPLIPPEQLDVVAKIAFGADDAAAQARVLRGHAVMATFRRGRGEVFNAGTTEWAHGLGAGDPFVERITHNVLARFTAASEQLS